MNVYMQGKKIFKAKEKSECCERQYCGPKRGFRIEVTGVLKSYVF